MKENWTYKKLGEICEITMGQSPVGTSINANDGIEFHQGKVFFGDKFLSPSNVYTNAPTKLAEAHSLLLCVRAPVGIINITERPICIGRGLCSISSHCDVNSIFVYYALLAKQQYFEKNSTGSTFKAISSNIVKNTPIPVPPLSEQQSIVRELDLLNDLIAKKRAQVAEYDQLQQSLFYTMFGDPVTNEKGWEITKLSNVLEAKSLVKRAVKVFDSEENISYIDISSVDNKNNRIIGYTDYIFSEAPSRAQQVVTNGDIIVSLVRPNLRNIAIVQDTAENLVASSGFCVLRANEKQINTEYLFFVVKTNAFTEYLCERVSGANYPAVREDDIKSFNIPLPPLPLQQEFAKKVEAIEALKAKVNDSIRETETLLASRMDYYFG